MQHGWLDYAPLGLLLLAVLGGVWGAFKVAFVVGRHFARLDSRLGEIEKQFHPNGGSSLKDDINTIKGDVRDINTRFDDHLKQHAGSW